MLITINIYIAFYSFYKVTSFTLIYFILITTRWEEIYISFIAEKSNSVMVTCPFTCRAKPLCCHTAFIFYTKYFYTKMRTPLLKTLKQFVK